MSKKLDRKTCPGVVNFRFSLSPDTHNSVESILNTDVNGPKFEAYDPRIPIDELGDSFTMTYRYMADEFGNNIPGSGRGLKDGDWILIQTFERPWQESFLSKCLVGSWRYKGALEKYCAAIAWEEDMKNAVYILKKEFVEDGSRTGNTGA